MNLFDDTDNIIINIDGKDIEMKPAICHGKVYDKWYVSKCGKVWSLHFNRILKGSISYNYDKNGRGRHVVFVSMKISTPIGFWEDSSSGLYQRSKNYSCESRPIKLHKLVMDTWKPLYDTPPKGTIWEDWKIARDLPTIYDTISKSLAIDHIDDDPTNNHVDNLERVTQWDNNPHIKKRLK